MVVFCIAADNTNQERLALVVFAGGETDFGILSSDFAREVRQGSVLMAHGASSSATASFFRVFDGARDLHAADQVARQLARLASGARGAASSCPHAAGVVDATMVAELEGGFERRFRPIEYVGPAHPESAFVVMGAAGTVAFEAVVLGAGSGGKVGLLKVRLPGLLVSPTHILTAPSASVHRVNVLEQTAPSKTACGSATAGALSDELADAFSTGGMASRARLGSGAGAEGGVLGAREAADVVSAGLTPPAPRAAARTGPVPFAPRRSRPHPPLRTRRSATSPPSARPPSLRAQAAGCGAASPSPSLLRRGSYLRKASRTRMTTTTS